MSDLGELVRIPLCCPKCGSAGVALWEKAPHLPDVLKLLSLLDGFYHRPMIGTDHTPEIICDHCGTGQHN